MRRILFPMAVVLAMVTVGSCGKLFDSFSDLKDQLEDAVENYEERLSLSDEEMYRHLRGKWILNKVGRVITTSNKYNVEQVKADPNLISSIESLEIDGSTFKFNFKEKTKFERHFWTEGVGHMQTEYLWYDSYTAEEGSTTLYIGFDINNVEVFTLMDYTDNGLDAIEIFLFGEDLLGNGDNLKVNRMVIHSTSDEETYYEFIPAK